MKVELIWQRDCPHVSAARESLMRAFSLAGAPARWREWCLDEPGCPEHARAFGSPTVLVDGGDVAGLGPGATSSCRQYRADDGAPLGAPPAPMIAAALGRHEAEPRPSTEARWSWKRLGAMAPAVGLALLPKIACPACWPAYAGVLSSLGVSFLIDARYLLALTAAFLAVALFFLAFRARRRHGYGPFALGLVASLSLLVGKFYFESDPAMFAGVALLMGASLWNSWPRRVTATPARSDGAPGPSAGTCCGTPTPQPPPACCGSVTRGETS